MPDTTTKSPLPGIEDVMQAAGRIKGQAVKTPLLEYPALNARTGGRILLKAETLQRTGSFKFRGAFNRLAQIPTERRQSGVLAYSSGNHAQGVAAAAEILGIPATIVMPADAPAIKIANTRGYGAEVVFYDRYSESREEICENLSAASGATLVRPFDDPQIIAGQGTCGLEISHQAEERQAAIDKLLICCGGGGLTAGCCLAMAARSPATEVFGVEPEDFDDTARSLAAGERLANKPEARSFCDALLSPSPGELTFAINRTHLAGGLKVSDDQVAQAIRYAFDVLKLVVEPGGAVALAAVLAGCVETEGKVIAATLSGGNVDPALYREILSGRA